MLRTTANMLATGLLFLGLLHSFKVIAPGRAIDGKLENLIHMYFFYFHLFYFILNYMSAFTQRLLYSLPACMRSRPPPDGSVEGKQRGGDESETDCSGLLFLSPTDTCEYLLCHSRQRSHIPPSPAVLWIQALSHILTLTFSDETVAQGPQVYRL